MIGFGRAERHSPLIRVWLQARVLPGHRRSNGRALSMTRSLAVSAFPSIVDLPQRYGHVSFVPIVLKKSFWGDERNFLEPLMRFTHGPHATVCTLMAGLKRSSVVVLDRPEIDSVSLLTRMPT